MRKGLIILIVIVVVVGGLGIWLFNLPQRIGLAETPTEKLLTTTPDREAAAAIKSDLQAAGANTDGVDIYVFPMKGTEDNPSEDNLAVAVLDATKGFDFRNFNDAELTDYLEKLASVGQSGEYNIERVAVTYRDENGESLMTLTAPTETILKFKNGSISREQFLREMEGEVNFIEVAKKITELAQ